MLWSPVDETLDCALLVLRAGIRDGALHARDGGVPSIVDLSRLHLHLKDLTASVVDVAANDQTLSPPRNSIEGLLG